MATGLDQITLTRRAREVLDLAAGCGLCPRVGQGGPGGYGRGRTSAWADSRLRSGLFGTIVINRILWAFLLSGNQSVVRRYEGAAELRTVISSWDAVMRPMREEARA